jgi:hypothetical protein
MGEIAMETARRVSRESNWAFDRSKRAARKNAFSQSSGYNPFHAPKDEWYNSGLSKVAVGNSAGLGMFL